MVRIEHIPLLRGYSITLANDVVVASEGTLPIDQRLATRQPYEVEASFLLNGDDHDALMALWRANEAQYMQVQLTIEDSQLRWYDCLPDGAPSVTPLLGDHIPWTPDDIKNGTGDTSKCYYESTWRFLANAPNREDEDLALLDEFETANEQMFLGFKLKG